MSANRKLLTEIQQVLKKIEEGVELFDDIWGKVYAAEQQALKEKYEADLKKEIKKLQRLRDQIKSWLGSSEIKDKNQLLEARKIIETKMEQFKICERDTKTKAYSREGLARESRLDPKEAEREEKRAWTNDCLDRLNDIVDAVSADVDKLSSGRSKAKNKEQIEKFENKLRKNRWHIARLEQIIKLIDNEELDLSKLDAIKDDVEYYIETANDDDGALGVDDEFDIYEELQLDAISLRSSEKAAAAQASEGNEEEDADMNSDSSTDVQESEESKAKKQSVISSSPLKAIAAVLPQVNKLPIPIPVKPTAPTKSISVAPTPPVSKASSSPGGSKSTPGQSKSDGALKNVPANPLPSSSLIKEPVTDGVKSEASGNSWASLAQKPISTKTSSEQASTMPSTKVLNQTVADTAVTSIPPINRTDRPEKDLLKAPDSEPSPALISLSDVNYSADTVNFTQNFNPTSRSSMEMLMLKSSSLFTLESLETERQSSYNPRNPTNTHPSFPTQPIPSADNFQFLEKLPVDTLFLAFYYQQGSYQQYLAAKKLKQASWRFHKKFLTWFQRHEEPKRSTDQYEEGTYVYFDFESGWCQRIKSDFKFEYSFLEDELSVP